MTNADNYYMGEEYYYEIINNYDIEIRFFIFDLDENIDKQMQFIENHDVNGLSLTAHEQNITKQFEITCRIIEKLNHRLLLLNLTKFEELESLDILNFTPNLKELWLHCKLKNPFDFTKLSKLESLRLWYGQAFSSIFDCTGIKQLRLFKIDAKAMEKLPNLYQLKDLEISQSNIKSIDGLGGLNALEKLSLRYLPKLETISPIKTCDKIKELYFQNCKRVTDWEIVGNFSVLKIVSLDNCGTLNNIDFLKQLEDLENVSLIVNTKLITGNVRWLYERTKINHIHLPWRNDFDISLEEYRNFDNLNWLQNS